MTTSYDFDAMIELIRSYCKDEGAPAIRLQNLLRDVREIHPNQFPKLMVLMEAHKRQYIFKMFPLADKVEILRNFEVTPDFQADVRRLLDLVMDGHALAEFETIDDPYKRAAKILVDRHGDNATWQEAMAILAEQ
jgi:hypothetical protein